MPEPGPIAAPAGPLRGVRVVEACEGVAGPHAGWLLAELGCDVIKLERDAGDPLRASPAFHVLNRSKRSVRLTSLAHAGDAARLVALLRAADVLLVDRELLEELEPAPAAALDGERLLREQPRLVHCTVSGFGERGPLAGLPADDGLVAAASGIAAMQWSHGGGPIYLTTPLTAYGCGMMAALAVTAALRARLLDGLGQRVHASQLAAALLLQSGTYVTGPRSKGSLVATANDPHGIMPTYAFYQASDDWLFVGALTETFWARLCLTIERPDLLEDPELQGTPMAFAFPPARRLRVRRTLEEAFARAPREEWLARLRDNDVPAGPILDRTTFLRDEGTRAVGMHVELHDPELGLTEQPGVPLRFARTPGAIRGPAPRLGAHDDEVWREWYGASSRAGAAAARDDTALQRAQSLRGWSDDPAHARNAARATLPRAPLDGVRVVSFATFIAGALCPMLLADLGAEVIKVEPLGGDPFRPGTTFGFLGWNRGTRSLAVDVQRDEGRALVLRLVERADLVVDNFRCGVLARLGLDFAALERVNPRVVQLSISGYGPDGPLSHLPCFDPIMQGRSGLARAQSGFDPTMYTVAYTDYATATMAALACVAALVARDAPGGDGRGQAAWTSLLNGACVMQAGFLIEYAGKPPDPPGAIDLRGASAWKRAYPCADGWLFVAAASALERAALLGCLGVAGVRSEHGAADRRDDDGVDGATARAIAVATAPLGVADALTRLRAAGVPAVACPTFPGIVHDEHLRANGLWWSSTHPELGDVVQTGEVMQLSRTPMRLGPTAPRLGEHSVEVLREAGIDEATIECALAAGVVRQAEPSEGDR